MKSLHQFMFDKELSIAVRFDTKNLSTSDLNLKTTQGDPVQYALLSMPVYLAERVFELLATRPAEMRGGRVVRDRRGHPTAEPH